jgi:hypothetical protein
MKKLSLVLVLAVLLSGGTLAAFSTSSQAQVAYAYPAPPPNSYSCPWVGSNTPWVYYRGDWFLNGVLYNNFGPRYGWAPYYAYAPNYIVRPVQWYGSKWNAWYQGRPNYWETFNRRYPYWRGHYSGRHYDRDFYMAHHRGQGGGWHHGYHGDSRTERWHHDNHGYQGDSRAERRHHDNHGYHSDNRVDRWRHDNRGYRHD